LPFSYNLHYNYNTYNFITYNHGSDKYILIIKSSDLRCDEFK